MIEGYFWTNLPFSFFPFALAIPLGTIYQFITVCWWLKAISTCSKRSVLFTQKCGQAFILP